jgi:hypothetical protein
MKKNLNRALTAVAGLGMVISSVGFAVTAKADTAQARCDVYPKGQDKATSSGLCTFSQRQGYVSIQLKNGTRYELTPTGSQPGNYVDQNGKAAYRQAGLGDKGQIYRLATQSIYVYWNTGSSSPSSMSSSSTGSSVAARGVSTLTASAPSDRVNVRSQPTINSSSPHYGLPGDKVTVIRCVQDQDTAGSDLNWCNVQFVQSKATGWVRSDFIIFADGGE